jgi:hypothetical protein
MPKLMVSGDYEWNPALKNDGSEYFFPDDVKLIQKNHKLLYKLPAIYRWNIKNKEGIEQKIAYLGEADQLFPNRIKGYISPGSDQKTNIRINQELNNFLKENYIVALDRLEFEKITINGFDIVYLDLWDKHIRVMLESIFIVFHEKNGYKLLNK